MTGVQTCALPIFEFAGDPPIGVVVATNDATRFKGGVEGIIVF